MNRRWSSAVAVSALCIVALKSQAQQSGTIHEGAWIIGGSAGLSRGHDDASNSDNTSFHLAPTGLLFVSSRVAVGGTGVLSYSSFGAGHATAYGIGPGARYYIGDLSGEFLPFIAASFTPQWQSSHVNTSSTDVTGHAYVTDASLGLTRFLATHVGLTGELYYAHVSLQTDLPTSSASSTSYSYGVRFGLNAFVR